MEIALWLGIIRRGVRRVWGRGWLFRCCVLGGGGRSWGGLGVWRVLGWRRQSKFNRKAHLERLRIIKLSLLGVGFNRKMKLKKTLNWIRNGLRHFQRTGSSKIPANPLKLNKRASLSKGWKATDKKPSHLWRLKSKPTPQMMLKRPKWSVGLSRSLSVNQKWSYCRLKLWLKCWGKRSRLIRQGVWSIRVRR